MSEKKSDLFERGMRKRQQMMGGEGLGANLEKMQERNPRMVKWIMENLFGESYANEILDLKTRSLCTLSALIVQGHEGPLTNHFRGALNLGVTAEELSELVGQMVWYAGLPAAGKALSILDRVLTER